MRRLKLHLPHSRTCASLVLPSYTENQRIGPHSPVSVGVIGIPIEPHSLALADCRRPKSVERGYRHGWQDRCFAQHTNSFRSGSHGAVSEAQLRRTLPLLGTPCRAHTHRYAGFRHLGRAESGLSRRLMRASGGGTHARHGVDPDGSRAHQPRDRCVADPVRLSDGPAARSRRGSANASWLLTFASCPLRYAGSRFVCCFAQLVEPPAGVTSGRFQEGLPWRRERQVGLSSFRAEPIWTETHVAEPFWTGRNSAPDQRAARYSLITSRDF